MRQENNVIRSLDYNLLFSLSAFLNTTLYLCERGPFLSKCLLMLSYRANSQLSQLDRLSGSRTAPRGSHVWLSWSCWRATQSLKRATSSKRDGDCVSYWLLLWYVCKFAMWMVLGQCLFILRPPYFKNRLHCFNWCLFLKELWQDVFDMCTCNTLFLSRRMNILESDSSTDLKNKKHLSQDSYCSRFSTGGCVPQWGTPPMQ